MIYMCFEWNNDKLKKEKDAIMKFVNFTLERNQEIAILKNTKDKSKTNSSSDIEKADKIEYDSDKWEMYLAAAVNDSIEIYKLVPKLQNFHAESNGVNLKSSKTDQTTNPLKNRRGF